MINHLKKQKLYKGGNVLIPELYISETLWTRSKGLLGTSSLSESEGLWILHCDSIHTFFMKFTIDCVFLTPKLVVKKIHHRVPPWRLKLPVWGANSVIELKQGQAQQLGITKGDQLNVGD